MVSFSKWSQILFKPCKGIKSSQTLFQGLGMLKIEMTCFQLLRWGLFWNEDHWALIFILLKWCPLCLLCANLHKLKFTGDRLWLSVADANSELGKGWEEIEYRNPKAIRHRSSKVRAIIAGNLTHYPDFHVWHYCPNDSSTTFIFWKGWRGSTAFQVLQVSYNKFLGMENSGHLSGWRPSSLVFIVG